MKVIASAFDTFEKQVQSDAHRRLLLFQCGGGIGEMKECTENACLLLVLTYLEWNK